MAPLNMFFREGQVHVKKPSTNFVEKVTRKLGRSHTTAGTTGAGTGAAAHSSRKDERPRYLQREEEEEEPGKTKLTRSSSAGKYVIN